MAEDANLAAGNYGDVKKEEFQRDTIDERKELEEALDKIKSFCLDKTKVNIFLVDQDGNGIHDELINELVDLRLLHQVKSRVTVKDKPGKIYKALLLDVSQYTGERARREIEMIEFWKENQKETLRKSKLIYSA